MRRSYVVLIMLFGGLSYCGYSQSIGVLFDKVTNYPPYYIMMNVPIHHNPISCMGTDIWETLFVYEDSSYIYFMRDGFNPNSARLKSIGDSLYHQRFGYNSYDYYNPCGDSLFAIEYEGVDSNGLYWKDVHFLFPDSLCITKRKGRLVSTWKSNSFRATIGYARVAYDKKEIYDEALESFKMMEITDADSTLNELLRTSYEYNSHFRYITDYHDAIDTSCPQIDIYIERKRR